MVTARSQTVVTLSLFVAVFAIESVARLLGLFSALFLLAPPLAVNPWTAVTSIYAHASVGHLLSNAIGLSIPGLVLERRTTALRYHAFFVTSGVVAGVAQITVGNLVGPTRGVLGASGAVFAFIGYLLASNRLTDTAIGGVSISGRMQLLLFVAIAVVVTLATGSPGVALVAHFTGLLFGLVTGRAHLLRAPTSVSLRGT